MVMMHFPERDLSHAAVVAAKSNPSNPVFGKPFGSGIYGRYLKRVFDTLAILASLPIILPVIAVLALLIRRDGGPAFYSQDRVGRHGGMFRFWKLRSMVVDADARLADHLAADPEASVEWDATQKLKNDPRITGIGRIIRKASLDELPQLLNVLRGDMSLVGPRPMMPEQMGLYPGRAYFDLRPGLTGFWQIGDRNETNFSDRAVYDTRYARRLSFTTDLSILARTIRPILHGTGY